MLQCHEFFLVTLFLTLLLECSAETILITISALPLKKILNFAFVTKEPTVVLIKCQKKFSTNHRLLFETVISLHIDISKASNN